MARHSASVSLRSPSCSMRRVTLSEVGDMVDSFSLSLIPHCPWPCSRSSTSSTVGAVKHLSMSSRRSDRLKEPLLPKAVSYLTFPEGKKNWRE